MERPSTSNDKARDDGVALCPYCHEEFDPLSFHQYRCQSSISPERLSGAVNSKMLSLNSELIQLTLNDCDNVEEYGKCQSCSEENILNDDTTKKAICSDDSDEEVEENIRKLYWSIQTEGYAAKSVGEIGLLFGLDEIDKGIVFLIEMISRYVFTHLDFVKIVKKLRQLIIADEEFRSDIRRLLQLITPKVPRLPTKYGHVDYHIIVRILFLVHQDVILVKIIKRMIFLISSIPLIDMPKCLVRQESNFTYLEKVNRLFFMILSDEEFHIFMDRTIPAVQICKSIKALIYPDDSSVEFIQILKELMSIGHSDIEFRESIQTLINSDKVMGNLVEFTRELITSIESNTEFAGTMGTIVILDESASKFNISEMSTCTDHWISIRSLRNYCMDFDMNHVLDELKRHTRMSWDLKASGSSQIDLISCYADRDYLLWPTQVRCRIVLSKERPCFCRVFIKNKEELPLAFQEIIDHGNELTPSKFRVYVFSVFDSFLSKAQASGWRIERKINKKTSPAYTMNNLYFQTEYDLVPCLPSEHQEASWFRSEVSWTEEELNECHIYVVPKPPNEDDNQLWRISFSSYEQKIIQERLSETNRLDISHFKDFLKKMKFEFENEGDWKLSSYPLVSCVMNMYCEWCEVDEHPSLEDILSFLINSLKKRSIPHFFIPELNLLQDVDDTECELFMSQLSFDRWSQR